MQYMCLIYSSDSAGPAPETPEFGEMMEGYGAFTQEVRENGVMTAGDPLQPVSTGVAEALFPSDLLEACECLLVLVATIDHDVGRPSLTVQRTACPRNNGPRTRAPLIVQMRLTLLGPIPLDHLDLVTKLLAHAADDPPQLVAELR